MQVKVRHLNPELEHHGPLHACGREYGTLGARVDLPEIHGVDGVEVGGVLHMLPRNDERVPGHGPVIVQENDDAVVIEHDRAGAFGRITENAAHGAKL